MDHMPFDLQPTLKGQFVDLQPLQEKDFTGLYAVASDPLIWELHPNADRYKKEVFREFFREAMESGGALIAFDAKTGKIIGSSRYYGYDEVVSEIQIGWTFLARSHWGGVYNGEMKRLMMEHAFKFVEHVVFYIGPDNHRSRRAVEKLGAIYIGTRPNTTGRDSVVYPVTAPAERAQNYRRSASDNPSP